MGAAGPFCPGSHPNELAVVPADHAGPVTAAELHAAPKGCSYSAASYDAWGIAAVEDCGGTGGWLGSAHLVQLNAAFQPALSLPLPSRPDGVTLSASSDGRQVLVDEYQAPATTPPGDNPTEWLFDFDGRHLRTVLRDGSGVDSLEFAAWY